MTYANDCIEIAQRRKRRTLKRIEAHTTSELDAAIEVAYRKFGEDFYLMLHGIDAYMERRKRRAANRVSRVQKNIQRLITDNELLDHWKGINSE